MKQKALDLFYGFLIGLIVTIPGFSIGTLAITLNIYERLINDISDIVKHPWQIIKKDVLLLVGFIVGFILDIILISYLLENFPFDTACFFAGLAISSLIPILKNGIKCKKERLSNNYLFEIITCVVTLSTLIVVVFLNAGTIKDIDLSFGFLIAMLLCGMIGAGFMIIPGISGSLIVLALGYYDSIIASLKGFGSCIVNNDYSNFMTYFLVIIIFIIGAILGLILISKAIKKLLEKVPSLVYFGIFGLLLGSPFAIIYLTSVEYNIDWTNVWMYIIGVILLAGGFVFGMFANKLENKNNNKKIEGTADDR